MQELSSNLLSDTSLGMGLWEDLNQSSKDRTDNTEERSGLEWMVNNGIVAVMVVGVGGVMSG